MALKTAALQEAGSAELTDQETEEFFDKLDEFRQTLTDREQTMLAVMVVQATDGEDAPAAEGQPKAEPPSDDEFDAFAAKLTEFHNSLPGNQHVMVDRMLGKTWFQNETEVEGYYWVPIDSRRIKVWQYDAYREACGAVGGDRVSWVKRRGSPWVTVACWDWE